MFSVIIPAFNAEETIVRALDSVKKQTKLSKIHEVIVVNDGSTDNTKSIVEHYINSNNLRVRLINKENGGVSSARNVGMSLATGEWIALLDADDEWEKNKIEVQLNEIYKDDTLDFIGANHREQPLKILFKSINQIHEMNIHEMCIKMYPQTSTVVFKKRIYDEIGGYDESRRYAEDGQFFMKICEVYKCLYIPERLVVFDNDKRGFGGNGLSGNLREMNDGVLINYKELLERKSISLVFYLFIVLFNQIKYYRRLIISNKCKK